MGALLLTGDIFGGAGTVAAIPDAGGSARGADLAFPN